MRTVIVVVTRWLSKVAATFAVPPTVPVGVRVPVAATSAPISPRSIENEAGTLFPSRVALKTIGAAGWPYVMSTTSFAGAMTSVPFASPEPLPASEPPPPSSKNVCVAPSPMDGGEPESPVSASLAGLPHAPVKRPKRETAAHVVKASRTRSLPIVFSKPWLSEFSARLRGRPARDRGPERV